MKALSHTNDPLSSYQAAETVNLRGWHKRIYEVLKRQNRPDGYTAKELAYIMAEDDWRDMYFKVSKRLKEMINRDLIIEGKPRPSLIGSLCNKRGELICERTVRAK